MGNSCWCAYAGDRNSPVRGRLVRRPGRGPLRRLTIDLSCTCGVLRADLRSTRMLIAGPQHLHVILDKYAAPYREHRLCRARPGTGASAPVAPPTSCHRRYGVAGSPAVGQRVRAGSMTITG